jgi:hypothetical protein
MVGDPEVEGAPETETELETGGVRAVLPVGSLVSPSGDEVRPCPPLHFML